MTDEKEKELREKERQRREKKDTEKRKKNKYTATDEEGTRYQQVSGRIAIAK